MDSVLGQFGELSPRGSSRSYSDSEGSGSCGSADSFESIGQDKPLQLPGIGYDFTELISGIQELDLSTCDAIVTPLPSPLPSSPIFPVHHSDIQGQKLHLAQDQSQRQISNFPFQRSQKVTKLPNRLSAKQLLCPGTNVEDLEPYSRNLVQSLANLYNASVAIYKDGSIFGKAEAPPPESPNSSTGSSSGERRDDVFD